MAKISRSTVCGAILLHYMWCHTTPLYVAILLYYILLHYMWCHTAPLYTTPLYVVPYCSTICGHTTPLYVAILLHYMWPYCSTIYYSTICGHTAPLYVAILLHYMWCHTAPLYVVKENVWTKQHCSEWSHNQRSIWHWPKWRTGNSGLLEQSWEDKTGGVILGSHWTPL